MNVQRTLRIALCLALVVVGSACASAPTCPKPVAVPKAEVKDQLLHAKQSVEEAVLAAFGRDANEFAPSSAKIPLYVAPTRTNLDDEQALAHFFRQQTFEYLSAQVHLEVQADRGVGTKNVLEQHVIAMRDAGGQVRSLMLLALVKDARTDVVLASAAVPIGKVRQAPEYVAFKQQHKPERVAIAQSRIRVEAQNVGKGYQTFERVSRTEYSRSSTSNASASGSAGLSSGRRSDQVAGYGNASGASSSTTTTSHYRDMGVSGWYPMEQQIALNGTAYKLDRDGVFLDDVIPPGDYELTVSFREGFWDAASKRQVEGKKHERTFNVSVERGQQLRLNVVFVCDDKNRDIQVAAL